jgi:large subunit ribosomal protein L22
MSKLIASAAANARNKGVNAEELVISTIEVNGGIVFKRMMPRARGRGAPIRKRTSHITLGLSKKAQQKSQKKEVRPAPQAN